jgi:hypothetical protein
MGINQGISGKLVGDTFFLSSKVNPKSLVHAEEEIETMILFYLRMMILGGDWKLRRAGGPLCTRQ